MEKMEPFDLIGGTEGHGYLHICAEWIMFNACAF